jgi:hypothetical protein
MTTPAEQHAIQLIPDFTEEDLAALDSHLEVPYFYETRKRFKAWRARRASSKCDTNGDAVAAGEVAQGPGSVE